MQKLTVFDSSAEDTLKSIADIILICGIIATVLCGFNLIYIEQVKDGYSYTTEKVFSPYGFVTTVAILLSSLVSWSIMRVLAVISLTLKDMNRKIKEKDS